MAKDGDLGPPHDEIFELLFDYEAGRLDAVKRARVEEHIAVCPRCREAHRNEKLLRQLLDPSAAPFGRITPQRGAPRAPEPTGPARPRGRRRRF